MTLLRGCIILQALAGHPVACVIPCVRFNRAVSPPVGRGFREHVWSRGVLRGFDGLANTTATLGSFYWLGFETSGLSPDKKRLAWLGAQRQSARTVRERKSMKKKLKSLCTVVCRALFASFFILGNLAMALDDLALMAVLWAAGLAGVWAGWTYQGSSQSPASRHQRSSEGAMAQDADPYKPNT